MWSTETNFLWPPSSICIGVIKTEVVDYIITVNDSVLFNFDHSYSGKNYTTQTSEVLCRFVYVVLPSIRNPCFQNRPQNVNFLQSISCINFGLSITLRDPFIISHSPLFPLLQVVSRPIFSFSFFFPPSLPPVLLPLTLPYRFLHPALKLYTIVWFSFDTKFFPHRLIIPPFSSLFFIGNLIFLL